MEAANIIVTGTSNVPKLTVGEAECAKINTGKKANVLLMGGKVIELNVHGGTKVMWNSFRYVMHTAKRPRKEYIHDDRYIHENIARGYYTVDPMRIVELTNL